MIDWRLKRQLAKASGRIAHLRGLMFSAMAWFCLAAAAIASWASLRWMGTQPASPWWFLAAAAVALVIIRWWGLRRTRNVRWVANQIEASFPELETSLLAAIDVEPDPESGKLGYLQDRVVGKALGHAYQHGWEHVVPVRRLAIWHAVHFAAFLALVGSLVLLGRSAASVNLAGTSLEHQRNVASDKYSIRVEPGDTEVERGSSLLVMARFDGPLPSQVTLVATPEKSGAASPAEKVATDAKGEETPSDSIETGETRVAMSKALNDPLFGGSIVTVNDPLTYYVEYAGQQSIAYRVRVFEYPRLERADAILFFPTYTTMGEKHVQDVRRISAVVGTRITLRCQLNKKVASAELIEKDSPPIAMSASGESSVEYMTTFVLEKSRKLELKLTDTEGRKNKQAVEFVFTALPNNPPDLKLAAPGRDVAVSPLEELDLKAKVFDDFGVTRVGVSFAMAGQQERELILGQNIAAKDRAEVMQLVALESLNARPDELLSYYFWAEDVGPDSQTRRVSSDMYFAEVRPFEEIYRQGQAPPSGEGMPMSGNARQAENLSQLQKEIVNATWKIVRRETGTNPTSAYGSDIQLLHESQVRALGQAVELSEKLEDTQSLKYVDDVLKSMQRAITELSAAVDHASTAQLRPALDAEQAAYQALLKLRAREHQVVRSRQQQSRSGASGSSRSQQQIDQLDLKDQENRYETERTAQPEENPAEREMRQVLNRLKELAQRQEDLNERVKELEAQLEQAETEAEREELKRQLKRLQEEQEQILRDTDELQQRMEEPNNAERMAESAQQLSEARERVRQSSESLREGMVQQAAAAGARAEEEFDQLRDEFRKQTSGHFRERMREMQQDARDLEQQEQKLSEQMRQLNDPQQKSTSLREAGDREKVAEGLGNQKQGMEQLLQQMRETIEEAEQPQPLLAEQLYETARKAQQQDVPRNLDFTREMLLRGFDQQAQQQEAPVGRAMGELREGIERAARNVLGDETEALRRAQNELRDLSQHVQEELRRNGQASDQAGDSPAESSSEDASRNAQNASNSSEDRQAEPDQPGTSPGEPGSREAENSQEPADDTTRSDEQEGRPEQSDEAKQGNGKGKNKGNRKGKGSEKGKSGGSQQGSPSSESGQQDSQGEASSKGSQPGNPQNSKSNGSGSGQSNSDSNQQNSTPDSNQPPQDGSPNSPNSNGSPRNSAQRSGAQRLANSGDPSASRAGFEQFSGISGGDGNQRMLAPFTGEDFRSWSDRLRDVEELLSDPKLSAEAARIREQARGIRGESQRHASTPNWDLVKLEVSEPLVELLSRVSQEVARKSGKELLAPIDRDPVPPEYTESVKKYFERLGAGR